MKIDMNTVDLLRPNGHRIRYIRYTNPKYYQVHYYNENHQILWWFDGKGRYQEFRWTLKGYKKNGEPDWACDIIHSTIHFIRDEKKMSFEQWNSEENEKINQDQIKAYHKIFYDGAIG